MNWEGKVDIKREVHICQCPICQHEAGHPDKELHRQINLFLSRLDEQQRRWYIALESKRIGHGGDRLLSQITGMDDKTIRRGREEIEREPADRPVYRTRLPGAGRPPIEKKRRMNRRST
ncbi:hypothetical protein ES703_104672 [subsurface metagenome]